VILSVSRVQTGLSLAAFRAESFVFANSRIRSRTSFLARSEKHVRDPDLVLPAIVRNSRGRPCQPDHLHAAVLIRGTAIEMPDSQSARPGR